MPIIEENARRVKRMRLTPQCLLNTMKANKVGRKESLLRSSVPDDARVVNHFVDMERGEIVLIIQSETFEPVPFDEIIPLVDDPVLKDLGVKPLVDRSGVLALSLEQVSSDVTDAIVREVGPILERLRFEGNPEVRISLTLGRAIYDALSAQEGAHLLHPPIDPGFDLYHPSGIYLGDDRRNSTPLCLDETLDPYAIGWTVLPN